MWRVSRSSNSAERGCMEAAPAAPGIGAQHNIDCLLLRPCVCSLRLPTATMCCTATGVQLTMSSARSSGARRVQEVRKLQRQKSHFILDAASGSTDGWCGSEVQALSLCRLAFTDVVALLACSQRAHRVCVYRSGTAPSVAECMLTVLKLTCTTGDHPKAGKPMTTIDEPAGLDADGRRSKTPNGGMKLLEANRYCGCANSCGLGLISWVTTCLAVPPPTSS